MTTRALAAQNFDAIVALGVVIRGGTPHFDFLCHGAALGLAQVSVNTGVPIGLGVLACENEQQALERAGLSNSAEDRGGEAALAALSTAVLLHDLCHDRPAAGI